MTVAGLVLAAGAGRRMGGPKALVRDGDGTPWVVRAARTLVDGGCSPVLVVVGADAAEVGRQLDDESVTVVEAADWAVGMGASLRAGLGALSQHSNVNAVVITPVDVPSLGPDVVRRTAAGATASSLVRASYHGRPGHPVLIGRQHWAGVRDLATGDQGARAYLSAHPPVDVECADLTDGLDIDTLDALPPGHHF
ncbi:MAG: nucleotidyltransferase family protein [Nocardioidaceae bacterium]